MTHLILALALAALAAERLLELVVSRRHAKALLGQGGIEAGASHYRPMIVFHALFFAALPVEVLLLDRRPPGIWPLPAALLLAGSALRWLARRELGERWTTRVIVLPGRPPVLSGLYRFVRHPNYAGVVLELLGLPLAFGAWITAAASAAANAVLLSLRIRVEERALAGACGYGEAMAGVPRFLPLGRRGPTGPRARSGRREAPPRP